MRKHDIQSGVRFWRLISYIVHANPILGAEYAVKNKTEETLFFKNGADNIISMLIVQMEADSGYYETS